MLDVDYNWRNNVIATASADGTARLWDCHGQFEQKATLRAHTKPVVKLAFKPDGREITTCSEDGTAKIWRWEKGVAVAAQTLAHDDGVFSCQYSECGDRIVTACKDNSCRVWRRCEDDHTAAPMD